MTRLLPHFWWLLRRAFVATYEDGCLGTAKGAAYSALLAFFPVLTCVATILVQANAEEASNVIATFLFEVVPPGTQGLVLYGFRARGEQPFALLVIASLVSLWAASGFAASLMEGFDAAYHVPQSRPVIRQRMVAALLVLLAVLPSVGASLLVLFGSRTEEMALRWLGLVSGTEQLRGWVRWLGGVLRFGIALGTSVIVAALMYFIGPNRLRKKLRHAWPGAVVATVLWFAATSAFVWYVRNLARYNVLYGSIATAIALLVWMYLLALIALFGCEFNAERDRLQEATR